MTKLVEAMNLFREPHRASAIILRYCSHESNKRHPARPEVNTVMASNVGKSNTIIVDAMDSGNLAGARTLPLRCYQGVKLPLRI
jgi:hypothetical protein